MNNLMAMYGIAMANPNIKRDIHQSDVSLQQQCYSESAKNAEIQRQCYPQPQQLINQFKQG